MQSDLRATLSTNKSTRPYFTETQRTYFCKIYILFVENVFICSYPMLYSMECFAQCKQHITETAFKSTACCLCFRLFDTHQCLWNAMRGLETKRINKTVNCHQFCIILILINAKLVYEFYMIIHMNKWENAINFICFWFLMNAYVCCAWQR